MNAEEQKELYSMHQILNEAGLASFDTAFLERYSELFAKSLEGKGNYEFTDQENIKTTGT